MAFTTLTTSQSVFLENYLRGTGNTLTSKQAEANYGIKMNIVDGNITDGYRIMDEKKYLIFLLKYQ